MQAEEVGRELQRIGDDFNRTLLARVSVHVHWFCVFVGALTCAGVLGGFADGCWVPDSAEERLIGLKKKFVFIRQMQVTLSNPKHAVVFSCVCRLS